MRAAPSPLSADAVPDDPGPGVAARVLRGAVRTYQLTLRPMIGANCRYEPSCSHYAMAVLSSHGAARGSWLAAKRILRCHPLAAGGYDPPPEPPPIAGVPGTEAPSPALANPNIAKSTD